MNQTRRAGREFRRVRACRLALHAVAFALVLTAAASLHAAEADPPPARLKTLTLDELMDVDVTSVTRSQTPVAQAAAAVDVLTGEEIRRSGATTLQQHGPPAQIAVDISRLQSNAQART